MEEPKKKGESRDGCCLRLRKRCDFLRLVILPTILCICDSGSDFWYIFTVPIINVKIKFLLLGCIWLPPILFFIQSFLSAHEKTNSVRGFLKHLILRFFASITCNINLFLAKEIKNGREEKDLVTVVEKYKHGLTIVIL